MKKINAVIVTKRSDYGDDTPLVYPCDSMENAIKLKEALSERFLKGFGHTREEFKNDNLGYDLEEDDRHFSVTALYSCEDFIVTIKEQLIVEDNDVDKVVEDAFSLLSI